MSWAFTRFAVVAGMFAGMLFVSVATFAAGMPVHGSIYGVSAIIWGAGLILAARAALTRRGITIGLKRGQLDSNHHGKGDGEAATLRSTWQIVRLDNGLMPPPQFLWGRRLWVYAPSGRCWNFDATIRSARRYAESDANRARLGDLFVAKMKAAEEWPPRYAEGPDYLGAMLGAHGLGLKVIERPAPIEPELPDGLWDRDGRTMYECRACGEAVELECDPSEFSPDVAYCGRSPRCLP